MLFHSVTDVAANRELLKRRRYGVIEVRDETLKAIHLRPWPKQISWVEANWLGGWQHRSGQPAANKILLYYNQPFWHSRFLALKYIVSTHQTSYATFRGSLIVLDELARLKRIDAIVCEVTNARISPRLMERLGWERHLENRRRRHYIRRFYGEYPDHEGETILSGLEICQRFEIPHP